MPRKLTEAEKSANKEVLKLKRRAHTARRNAWDARLTELSAERVAPLNAVLDQKGLEFDAAFKARNDYDERCRAEVEALRQKHREERVPHETEVARLATERTAAASALISSAEQINKELEAEFPDLVGHAHYSVAAWTPPRGS